jgi:hypothetical protein
MTYISSIFDVYIVYSKRIVSNKMVPQQGEHTVLQDLPVLDEERKHAMIGKRIQYVTDTMTRTTYLNVATFSRRTLVSQTLSSSPISDPLVIRLIPFKGSLLLLPFPARAKSGLSIGTRMLFSCT